MDQKIIILDDFYEDPAEERAYALSLEYESERPEGLRYGGFNCLLREVTPRREALRRRLADITGAELRPGPSLGLYRINPSGSENTGLWRIHWDPETWGGVIYLNPPEQYRSHAGTYFWRHKKHGWERFIDIARTYPGVSPDEAFKIFVEETEGGTSVANFEVTNVVDMKWNRALLLRGELFHSVATGFGETRENARLIQLIFFSVDSPPNEVEEPQTKPVPEDASRSKPSPVAPTA